jgi:hypothetical protein
MPTTTPTNRLQRIADRLSAPKWSVTWERSTSTEDQGEDAERDDATRDVALLLRLAEAAANDDDDAVLRALEELEAEQ